MLSESSSVASNKRSNNNNNNNSQDDDDIPVPSLATVKKLEEVATGKLAEMVRLYKAGKKTGRGYDEAEIIAARELLDRDGKIER